MPCTSELAQLPTPTIAMRIFAVLKRSLRGEGRSVSRRSTISRRSRSERGETPTYAARGSGTLLPSLGGVRGAERSDESRNTASPVRAPPEPGHPARRAARGRRRAPRARPVVAARSPARARAPGLLAAPGVADPCFPAARAALHLVRPAL